MGEKPSVSTDVCRKARKEHKCCECRETIKVGDTYHFTSGIWEGRGDSFKTCAKCEALRHYIFGVDDNARYDGIAFEGGCREWCQNADENFAELRERVWAKKPVTDLLRERTKLIYAQSAVGSHNEKARLQDRLNEIDNMIAELEREERTPCEPSKP